VGGAVRRRIGIDFAAVEGRMRQAVDDLIVSTKFVLNDGD